LFSKPQYNWSFLSTLLWSFAKESNKLNIIDFGGSLGSTYFQHRLWLENFNYTWNVIEQPHYVEEGVADAGILGENVVWESEGNVVINEKLGFGGCRMSLAIPRDEVYTGVSWMENKRIATSYPQILKNYLQKKGITAAIEKTGGSVEVAPGIGLADAIFDIVSTGSTLMMNGLKEVEVIKRSEAVMISSKVLSKTKSEILSKLLFRIRSVKKASENKYILLNAPDSAIPEIISILPGMKSPTVLPLSINGWSSLHSVIQEDEFWEIINRLKKAGAEGILVMPIEKMIL